MKLILMSDLHGYLPIDVPECDMLLISGDICPNYNVTDPKNEVHLQKQWFFNCFISWINKLKCKYVVFTWGNHDLIGEHTEGLKNQIISIENKLDNKLVKSVYLLNDSSIEIEGIKIYGSPWSVTYKGKWAFNLPDEQLKSMWDKIPSDTNILLVHAPPYGIGDKTLNTGENAGSKTLLSSIQKINPTLVVCGHIHEGRGIYQINEKTTVVNAAQLDENYMEVPTYFERVLKWELQ